MPRASIVYASLFWLSSGACAQEAPDLYSLIFSPTRVSSTRAPESESASVSASASASAGAARPGEGSRADRSLGRLLDSLEDIEQALAREESLHGAQSRGLVDELTALASVYQEMGVDLPAIEALQRARHISRVNEGLHSLDQASIVEQLIDSMQATGQADDAAALQHSLLELAHENEGDARAPSLLTAVADRQMAAVAEYVEQDRWSGIREPVNATHGSGWEPSTPEAGRHMAFPKLRELRNSNEAAIEAALTSDDYEIGDPLALDVELAEIYVIIDTANDFVEEGFLPRFVGVSSGGSRWEPAPPVTDREFALAALRRARRLYSTAMQTALEDASYGDYFGIQERLLETYYFEMAHPELHERHVYDRDPHRRALGEMIYHTGASLLQARVLSRLTYGGSALEVASGLVELGDWYLLYSHNGTALGKYQDAYDFLVRRDVPVDDIANLFAPGVPAVLGASAPDFEAFDPARAYRGHVDVSIEIGRFGDATEIDISDSSPAATPDVERRLRRHIFESRFRPRFLDGRPADSDRFSLRYYFDY